MRRPLIVILGSTGTGKTKLSLELAQRYDGEVISADSMQVYANLDLATAKATKDEQRRVKHHLLDVAQPGLLYSVRQFQNSALPIIDDLLGRQKVPIIVGGTNYYIESILWKVLVDEWQDVDKDESAAKRAKLPEDRVFDQLGMNDRDSEELHEILKNVDPETAAQLHPNNKRKIIRALEVFERSGKLFSWFIKEQQAASGGSLLGGRLRYDNLVIFWLYCEQETLNERLDKRVDEMVKQGLITEIRQFHEQFVKPYGEEVDYTKGILQTIGFKEFLPYLTQFDRSEDNLLEEFFNGTCDKQPLSLPILTSCLEDLKLATRRYSKKQIKWVRNRFLRAGEKNRTIPPIYKLDTTCPADWNRCVSEPATNVVDNFLSSTVELNVRPELPPLPKDHQESLGSGDKKTYNCDQCQRVFIGEFQWQIHLKSNRHKKFGERLRKLTKKSGSSSSS